MDMLLCWLSIYLGGWMIAECCWECDDAGRVQLFQLPKSFPVVLEMMLSFGSTDVPCMYCKQNDFEEWMRLYGRLYFGN